VRLASTTSFADIWIQPTRFLDIAVAADSVTVFQRRLPVGVIGGGILRVALLESAMAR
jgi:hypothetical protein